MSTRSKTEETIKLIRENWREERIVAGVYREMARREANQKRKTLFTRMAEIEDDHAQMWEDRLTALGAAVDPSEYEPELRKQKSMVHVLGVDAIVRRIEKEERGHVSDYSGQFELLDDQESLDILSKIIPDEQAHAESLQAMAAETQKGPRGTLDSLLTSETWHKGGTGAWIGDAIYGVNDGLGAVFGIVSAVAGATGASSKTVVLAGLAGMIGSAFSMGSSGYLAAKSEREIHEAEIDRERREIEMDPAHEIEELELMYQIKGLSEEEAKLLASKVAESPEQLLNAMVSEELGLSEERLPNPWISAITGFTATAIGAILPIIPFFFTTGMPAVYYALVISIIAHFAVGASKTFVTGRSWLAQGWEMTFVGMIGGALAYGFGLLIGAHGAL